MCMNRTGHVLLPKMVPKGPSHLQKDKDESSPGRKSGSRTQEERLSLKGTD